jgi:hypothetical protein
VFGFGGGLVNALGNGDPSPETQTTPSETVLPAGALIAQVAARDRFSLAVVGG